MRLLIDNRSSSHCWMQYEPMIQQVVQKALEYENYTTECEVSLSFVTKNEIKTINQQFRGINRETDVLSFPQLCFLPEEIPQRNEHKEVMLGDIILCVEKAKEQAEEYGHSVEREIAFLTAHSMLHLLGYDHMEEPEELIMCQKQEAILSLLGIER